MAADVIDINRGRKGVYNMTEYKEGTLGFRLKELGGMEKGGIRGSIGYVDSYFRNNDQLSNQCVIVPMSRSRLNIPGGSIRYTPWMFDELVDFSEYFTRIGSGWDIEQLENMVEDYLTRRVVIFAVPRRGVKISKDYYSTAFVAYTFPWCKTFIYS